MSLRLRLLLIRHTKSDWSAGVDDHSRPLNDRGRRTAPMIGDWLVSKDAVPDAVLCSSARRTRDTWAGIASRLPLAPVPRIAPEIYEAAPETILGAIRAADGRTLAVIGHNPGIGNLAWMLADAPPDADDFTDYPTGATTLLSFPCDSWLEIAPGSGRVEAFTTARRLQGPD